MCICSILWLLWLLVFRWWAEKKDEGWHVIVVHKKTRISNKIEFLENVYRLHCVPAMCSERLSSPDWLAGACAQFDTHTPFKHTIIYLNGTSFRVDFSFSCQLRPSMSRMRRKPKEGCLEWMAWYMAYLSFILFADAFFHASLYKYHVSIIMVTKRC